MRKITIIAFALALCMSFANAGPLFLTGDDNVTFSNDGGTIDQFLAMLDGTEKAAEAAVAKYGSEEVIANGMIPYGKNPKIISRKENCVVVSLDDEGEANQYTLCEEDGKITTFDSYYEDESDDDDDDE